MVNKQQRTRQRIATLPILCYCVSFYLKLLIMKNYQVNKKLKQLFKAKVKYQRLLNEVESEIKKRHGCTPSDVDLDIYLDSYHFNSNDQMTIEEINVEMKNCIDSTERVDFDIDFE